MREKSTLRKWKSSDIVLVSRANFQKIPYLSRSNHLLKYFAKQPNFLAFHKAYLTSISITNILFELHIRDCHILKAEINQYRNQRVVKNSELINDELIKECCLIYLMLMPN